MIRASKRAIERLYPKMSSDEVNDAFVELHYGKCLADAVRSYRIFKKGTLGQNE
jgi:hypothetical protein